MTEGYHDDSMMMHMDADMEVAPAISLNIFFTVSNNFSSFIAAAKSDAVCSKSHGNKSGRLRAGLELFCSTVLLRQCCD